MIKRLQYFLEAGNSISAIWFLINVAVHFPIMIALFLTPLASKENHCLFALLCFNGISLIFKV